LLVEKPVTYVSNNCRTIVNMQCSKLGASGSENATLMFSDGSGNDVQPRLGL